MAKNPRTARFDLPIVFPGPFSGKMRGRKSGLSLLFCWSERRDLNPGPPVPQTGALTGLRYAPPGQWPMLYAARSGRARAAAGDGQVGFRSGRTRPHRLEIEAMVSNRDIGFVRAGDRAEIKVDTQFHPVRAAARRVLNVSTPAPAARRELSYVARISLDRTAMDIDGRSVNLRPGMAVTAEINTGTRRVIEYLLSPLLRYREESLRER